jgi:hypothetical protein
MIQFLVVLGAMSLMISLVVYQIYQARWLTHHGRQVIAIVTSIRQETGKSAWGFSRQNYYVTAAWTNPRTGRRYTFWTWIMSRPAFTQGSLIPVLIDPRHPECYAVNL